MGVLDRFKLSKEQKEAFEKLEETNDNYFVTGNAGTGKSFLLRYFLEHTKKKAVVLAPTGIAALNVGGQTIHSFFLLPPKSLHRGDAETHRRLSQNKTRLIQELDTIIIDEISMVSSDIMDIMEDKLQYIRHNRLPFGGCQLICFGDLYQLSPVVKEQKDMDYMRDRYGTFYFFGTPGVKQSRFKILNLKHVFRQNDSTFIKALNQIRTGEDLSDALSVINSRVGEKPNEEEEYVTLAPYNYMADRINMTNLRQLDTKLFSYIASIEGKFKPSDAPAPERLPLKVGARVMMLKNDYEREKPRWVNGTFATILEAGKASVLVKIGNKKYKISPEVWENSHFEYDEEEEVNVKIVDGSFLQLPMRLAYAITIHKSQGQTYDGLVLDLSRGVFANGQAYVALSRCRTLSGLYLTSPLKESDVMVDPAVIKFMEKAE